MELSRMPWRHALLATAVATCLGAILAAPTIALADATQPPVVTSISPQVLIPNGQSFHVLLTGFNLATVNQVFLNPAVPDRSFSVAGDTVLQLTLPPDTPFGAYTVRVVSPAGSSDGTAEVTVAATPAPPAPAGAAVAPRYSFAPYPGDPTQVEPQTGVIDPGVSVRHPNPPAPTPLNPLVLLPIGIVAGGLGYLLWGKPGRLAAADRQGLLAHVVGRPVQALHIGRVCLQCGRLHFVVNTRRDLWRAGQFCSATCFVAAQEDDSAARAGESTAVTRMREMFVYSELEESLKAALAGDVHALEHAAAIGDPHIEAVLAPPG
jgi:hypothetical protein